MRFYLVLSIVFFLGWSFVSCAQKSEKLKIGVIGDPHYLSEQLMDGGSAIRNAVDVSGKTILDVPQVLDMVLSEYLKSDIEVLLIPGDMTKDGEKQSHIDFVKKLQPLIDKGVKVYIIPGNHDINIPNPQRYEGDRTISTEGVTPVEFEKIYANCGYSDALKKDAASLSYVAQLNDNTWLLAIDGCRYDEYTTSVVSSGQISPATEQWIKEVMDDAKLKNIQVVSMMHHGLVEHIMFQATIFRDYIINDWQRLAPLFADWGIKAVFTGHFHANDITEYRSLAGNKIFDIETGALCAYPFPYRFVELDRKGMRVTTKNITSIPKNSHLAEQNKAIMENRGRVIATEKIRAIGMKLPRTTASLMANILGRIFVMHLAGDEVVDKELKESLMLLSKETDSPMDIPMDNIELDFYPADNNVEITF